MRATALTEPFGGKRIDVRYVVGSAQQRKVAKCCLIVGWSFGGEFFWMRMYVLRMLYVRTRFRAEIAGI